MTEAARSRSLRPVKPRETTSPRCYALVTSLLILMVTLACERKGGNQSALSKADTPTARLAETWVPVLKGNHYVFIDNQGQEKLSLGPELKDLGEFSDGLAKFSIEYKDPDPSIPEDYKSRTKDGFLDSTGKIVIKPTFDSASKFREGFSEIVLNMANRYNLGAGTVSGEINFIDTTGNMICAKNFEAKDGDGQFSEGLAPVVTENGWGFVNTQGKVVIPPRYTLVGGFSCGLAPVAVSTKGRFVSKWGYIDKNGAFIIPPGYDDALAYSDGLCMVDRNGKVSFLDSTGKTVLSKLDRQKLNPDSKGFSEGMLAYTIGQGFGYIGQDGKVKISGPYQRASDFVGGYAVVVPEGKKETHVIDKTGKTIVGGAFTRISIHPQAGMFICYGTDRIDGPVTAMNLSGKPIWTNR